MSQACEKLKRICVLAIALVAATALTSGRHDLARAEPVAAAPDVVAICVGGATGIPVWLANEQGLFAKQGLAVTLKKYATGSVASAAMLAGECDMTTAGETPVVMHSFERQDYAILATLATSDDSPHVLANKASGIQRPEDLKGKRIFVHKGSTNHFFLEMFLLQNGLSAPAVTLIFKDVEDVPGAFTNGRIDAFAATDVLLSKPRQMLGDKAVVFSSPGLCLITINLLAMNSVIKEKPQAVAAVLKALLTAEESINNERQQAIKTLAKAMDMNEQDMAAAVNPYQWSVALDQALLLSLEQEAQWAIDSGLTNKTRIPNYLDFIHRDALFSLRSEAVTILK